MPDRDNSTNRYFYLANKIIKCYIFIIKISRKDLHPCPSIVQSLKKERKKERKKEHEVGSFLGLSLACILDEFNKGK